MRVLSPARERLYVSITNRYPYIAYHVLNNVIFHGFLYNPNKRFECIYCGDQMSSWGRNFARACAQPEDLSALIEHADAHLLRGETRLPYEEIATIMPGPEVFCQMFNASCWDQVAYMSIALKKLAEDAGIRERTFYDNPAALAALHPAETVEDCVRRGLWYSAPQRCIRCAFCSYTSNALGVLHKENHSNYTSCPRLIDCTSAPTENATGAAHSSTHNLAGGAPTVAEERHELELARMRNELEEQLGRACATASTGAVSSDAAMDTASPLFRRLTTSRLAVDSRASLNREQPSVPSLARRAITWRGVSPTRERPFLPRTRGTTASAASGMARSPTRTSSAVRYSMARRSSAPYFARNSPTRGVTTRAMTSHAATAFSELATRQTKAAVASSVATNAQTNSTSVALAFSSHLRTSTSQQEQPQHVDMSNSATGRTGTAPEGILGVWQRLATEGYSAERMLSLLAKRTNENLNTYDEFKAFEHKVGDQEYLTLSPEERRCKVCLLNLINAVAGPCGHMQYCEACLQAAQRCCICQRRITRRLRVYSPFS